MEHHTVEANSTTGVQASTADLPSGESEGRENSSPIATTVDALLVSPTLSSATSDSG